MVTENAELMKMARQSLEGRWWQFIKATLVYYINPYSTIKPIPSHY